MPSAAVTGFDAIGRANEFLVATFYDATPDGLVDATFSRTVAATVRFASGPFDPPTVRLVDVKSDGEPRASESALPTSAESAVAAFLADPIVQERIGDETPTAPEVVHLSRGSSFAAASIGTWSFAYHAGDEPAPPLPPAARAVQGPRRSPRLLSALRRFPIGELGELRVRRRGVAWTVGGRCSLGPARARARPGCVARTSELRESRGDGVSKRTRGGAPSCR